MKVVLFCIILFRLLRDDGQSIPTYFFFKFPYILLGQKNKCVQ
jgi:hypothetical protein